MKPSFAKSVRCPDCGDASGIAAEDCGDYYLADAEWQCPHCGSQNTSAKIQKANKTKAPKKGGAA